jgi:hypothetical protein
VARECDHCEVLIVLLPMVWGAERPIRPYEAQMKPMSEVQPRARYAYSRRRGGVVQLEHGLPSDSPHLPAQSLVPHYCGRSLRLGEYTELLITEIDKQAPGLGDVLTSWIKAGPPARPAHETPPERRRGLGFRRGLGKKPAGDALKRLRAATDISEPRNPPSVDESVEGGEKGT